MSLKSLVFLLATIGGIIGGYIPVLFGIDAFSITSIIFSTLGALLGVYLAYILNR